VLKKSIISLQIEGFRDSGIRGFRDFEIRNPSISEFGNLLRKRRLYFGNPFIGYQTGKTK
jgi:hypothetical protein